jgi:hypothetical protein
MVVGDRAGTGPGTMAATVMPITIVDVMIPGEIQTAGDGVLSVMQTAGDGILSVMQTATAVIPAVMQIAGAGLIPVSETIISTATARSGPGSPTLAINNNEHLTAVIAIQGRSITQARMEDGKKTIPA